MDLSKGIDSAKSNSHKCMVANNNLSMGSNFKMVVMNWQCCALVLGKLLLSLLKKLIIVVLFITLANLMHSIC